MKYKRFAATALLTVMAGALFGCGNTTQAVSALGKPVTPGSNGSPISRLDFLVDNNQVHSDPATNKVNPIKSFILVQAQNTANPNFDFQFTDYKPDQNGLPTYDAATGYTLLNTTPFVYYDTRIDYTTTQNKKDQLAGIIAHLGTFDPATYSYTPPLKILPDDYKFPGQNKPLDTFALNAIPQDPALKSEAILIHLNLNVTIAPTSAALPANTPDALGAGGASRNRQTFTASVLGDGVRSAYNPAISGSGQVNWSCLLPVVDANGKPVLDTSGKQKVIDASGLIDKTTGEFTAPQAQDLSAAQTAYQITATSRTQPDKSATVTVTVTKQGTNIHLQ